jgi:hypothetical protein
VIAWRVGSGAGVTRRVRGFDFAGLAAAWPSRKTEEADGRNLYDAGTPE